MNVCVVKIVSMIMLLRDFGPYGIIFMNVCVIKIVVMLLLLRYFWPLVG
jgi:hypothetical protein